MTCGTCKHSLGWSRTPTGQFARNKGGRCTWMPGAIAVAACVTITVSRQAVWPKDHPECPTYEQGEPQR